MSIEPQTYIRKPLFVDAVQVTRENFSEIALWCQGEVQTNAEKGTPYEFIQVRVTNPMNPRQAQARVGDWILTSERGYKIYTPKAFAKAFDLYENGNRPMNPGQGILEEVAPGLYAGEAKPLKLATHEEIHAYYQQLAKDGRMTAEEATAAALTAIEHGAYVREPKAPVGTQPMPPQPMPTDAEDPARVPSLPENLQDRDPNVVYPTTPETTALPSGVRIAEGIPVAPKQV